VGSGSNLLFLSDYDGLVLHSAIQGVEALGETAGTITLRVGAGLTWDDFVICCVDHEWYGVENLSLIPGEVGAAAVQNIGAYGMEIKEVIDSVEAIDTQGRKHRFSRAECGYAYRDSLFKHHRELFVTRVIMTLSKRPVYRLDYGTLRQELDGQPAPTLSAVRQAVIRSRCAKLPDPHQLGNAGSFFKNPVVDRPTYDALHALYPSMPAYAQPSGEMKLSAGWLIEQCGWKGKRVGHAGTYDRQALVLVNYGSATGKEINALSDDIRHSVSQRFNITLIPEVNII
jgi:UDP-N-acetylmuramate dehydrogenase